MSGVLALFVMSNSEVVDGGVGGARQINSNKRKNVNSLWLSRGGKVLSLFNSPGEVTACKYSDNNGNNDN